MPLPIKFKKIHFLALFFSIIGVLFIVRLVNPEWATVHAQQISSQYLSQAEESNSTENEQPTENSTTFSDEAEDEEVGASATDTAKSTPLLDAATSDHILRHSKKVDDLYQQARPDVKLIDYRGRPLKNKIKGVSSYVHVFNDLNDVQIATASRIGIDRIANREVAASCTDSLVFIGNNPYYNIKELTHSIPYLVPRAAICLEEIARAFMDSCVVKGLPMHKVVLTSVLRTEADVKKLRRVNVNASQNSCHQHGTTFDISYNHFIMVQDPNTAPKKVIPASKLKRVLAEVLEDQRNLGTCYVKYEYRRSACFHITAR